MNGPVLAILQARVSSTRLPGKVLKPILGAPMLARQIERIQRSEEIEQLVVATSNHSSDDAIEALCNKLAVDCFRGSLNDVLDRFYKAALPHTPSHVVRLTGDCPLADSELIDRVIKRHLSSGADYTSNVHPPTWPDGLDVEVMRWAALKRAWQQANTKLAREHVSYFLYQHPDLFTMSNLECDRDLSMLRWTVDEPEDFELVEAVYKAIYVQNPYFKTQDILDWLEANPEWQTHNTAHLRNEGLMNT